MCRLRRSCSVKKKSPTSVSLRSICSTRRTREPLAAPYTWLGVAGAVAAEVAEAVEAAGDAEAARVAQAAAEPPPGTGASAGSSPPKQFPTHFAHPKPHARVPR